MSQPVVSVRATSLLDEALTKMISKRIRHLAVVDDRGRCVGILSDRVIAAAWAIDYDALSHRSAVSVLDDSAFKVRHRCTVVDAARLMRNAGTDAVVVVDDEDRPVGMVTGSDLVSLLAK